MATLKLIGSVGAGIKKGKIPHNLKEDVEKVRNRLNELGFTWVQKISLGKEQDFINTIKLFQSICKGSGTIQGDGRVDLKGNTHRWLAADNAPKWVKIFGQQGLGWYNTSDFLETNGGYCTNWLLKSIEKAGTQYYSIKKPDFPVLWIRECSPKQGGKARGHNSHQTGIDVDMRLPLRSPDTQKWTCLEEHGFKDKKYYQEAAKAQLEAIKANMGAKIILFNDPTLIKERLCQQYKNHHQHYHIRIKPLARIDGIYL